MLHTATVCSLIALLGSVPLSARELTFEADVRPILKTHCFDCHGEGEKLKGGVDLRLRHLMVEKTTDDGPVLAPGKPKASRLVQLVKSGEMPKGDKKLTAKEVAVIEAWGASGAARLGPEPKEAPKGFFITEVERKFWAFQPIARPGVPKVKNAKGAR